MKTLNLIAAACLLIAPSLSGAVVAGTNIILTPSPGVFFDADYGLTVFEDTPGNDATSIGFDVVGTTLQFVTTNVDGASDWYLTQSGDLFTADNILGDTFPFFVRVKDNGGFEDSNLDVGTSPFFLGVNADDYTSFYDSRGAFGWAQFQIVNGQLTMLDNAVSYGRGIIVGTNEAIPEPGALSLLAFAGLLALRRRR